MINYKNNSVITRIGMKMRVALALATAAALAAAAMLVVPSSASAATRASCNTQGHSGYNTVLMDYSDSYGRMIVMGKNIHYKGAYARGDGFCSIVIRKGTFRGHAKLLTIDAPANSGNQQPTKWDRHSVTDNLSDAAGPVWVNSKDRTLGSFNGYVGSHEVSFYTIWPL